MNLLDEERANFINGLKFDINKLSLFVKDDYYDGMRCAFRDAFSQYAHREGIKYADNVNELMKPVVDRLFRYFNDDNDSFSACFQECIGLTKNIFNNNRYGLAQKFINMSYKYLMCYGDSYKCEQKFKDCHMPLDKYTILWIKKLDKGINYRLNKIHNSWVNIDENLYKDIQNMITSKLNSNYEYIITYNKQVSLNTCILPKNKLYAEFIIWHQEQINEIYKMIEKAEPDFDRLGIEWR